MNGCLDMQRQKQEIKQRILTAAVEEFHQKGYRHASMREIAQKSGMTVGNIYLYFLNKQELFTAVVQPVLEGVEHLITQMPTPGQSPAELLKEIADALAELYMENRLQFITLMDGSAGSPYEDAKGRISLAVCGRIRYEQEMFPPYFRGNTVLFQALGASLMEGVVYILRQDGGDIAKLKETLNRFLAFLFSNLFSQPPAKPSETE